ncbi:MAG: DUF2267 domain-containing protein [Deltaproteobacteria bacterium]|nr:DUF2267 domain-containing protein [Deltaproteobacteria bacterium]
MVQRRLIVEAIAERTGSSIDAAETSLRHTLEALSDILSRDEATTLARALDESLGAVLVSPPRPRALPLAVELDERVAELGGSRRGRAREEALVVCAVLGESMSPASRRELQDVMPARVAAWFEPIEQARAIERVVVPPGEGRTLATGRPGSAHPLSESRPVDRAHAESVARSADPHAEERLSGARGLTQERVGESVANAEPEEGRRISRAREPRR